MQGHVEAATSTLELLGLGGHALLQRSILGQAHLDELPKSTPASTGKKVGIVGSGPAGLTAAVAFLRRARPSKWVIDRNSRAPGWRSNPTE